MRKPADTDRELERLFQAAPPRLEVGVAQPAEPGVIGTKSVELLEEPERLQQGEKGCATDESPQSTTRNRPSFA